MGHHLPSVADSPLCPRIAAGTQRPDFPGRDDRTCRHDASDLRSVPPKHIIIVAPSLPLIPDFHALIQPLDRPNPMEQLETGVPRKGYVNPTGASSSETFSAFPFRETMITPPAKISRPPITTLRVMLS